MHCFCSTPNYSITVAKVDQFRIWAFLKTSFRVNHSIFFISHNTNRKTIYMSIYQQWASIFLRKRSINIKLFNENQIFTILPPTSNPRTTIGTHTTAWEPLDWNYSTGIKSLQCDTKVHKQPERLYSFQYWKSTKKNGTGSVNCPRSFNKCAHPPARCTQVGVGAPDATGSTCTIRNMRTTIR